MKLTRRELSITGVTVGLTVFALSGWLRSPPEDERDVRVYGCRGDGRRDDSAALQRAIDQGGAELWFPPGTYRLTQPVRPRSGQHWRGSGADTSILVFGGDGNQPPFNLLESFDPLEGFSLSGLGFRGGRQAQLLPARDGQKGFAVYLRGALRAVHIQDCRFQAFGDGRQGGGGVVLGPVPGQAIPGPVDILVQGCTFVDNGNVPGIYISASNHGGTVSENIRIIANSFGGSVGSLKVQNAIYILGGGDGHAIRQVEISRNHFHFSAHVDAGIETNWVENFVIAGNVMDFQTALEGSTAILIRDGSAAGAVTGNIISSVSDQADFRGILLLNFEHPNQIRDVVITANVISGVPGAIAADRGSSGVIIADNRIRGRNRAGGFGIRIVDARDVRVQGNAISSTVHAIALGHGDQPLSGLERVTVEHNQFSDCGGPGKAMIAALYPPSGLAAREVIIRGNTVFSPLPGSILLDPALEWRDDMR